MPLSLRRRNRAERGLATLDVLLGMAIFGLIIVIGAQNTAILKERARVTAVQSDAKSIAEKIQVIGGADGATYAAPSLDSSAGDLMLAAHSPRAFKIWMRRLSDVYDPVTDFDLILSPGNRLVLWATNTPHFGYCIEYAPNGGQADGPWAAYRTDLGGVYAQGTNGGCTTLTPATPDPQSSTMPQDGDGPRHGPVPIPGSAEADAAEEEADAAATPSPSASPTPAPQPTTPNPALPYEKPTSHAEIEDLCARTWPQAIYGHGSVVYGTDDNDILFVGNQDQTIYGLGGDDLLCGGNGKDILSGGSGNDVLFGGNGKDDVYGGPGADILHGDNGKDAIYGDGEVDIVFGGNGTDLLLEGTDEKDFYNPAGPNSP